MPMPIAQIPGYYYDTEKKKYFKIEKTGTAPANATWSAANVKRRKIEDKAIASHQRRVERNKDRIKRARALDEVVLPGGFLSRELTGVVRPAYGGGRGVVRSWSAEGGGEGPGNDVRATAFADGLVEKGCLPLADARWATAAKRNVQHMYVDGRDEKTGLGVAFATVDGDSLLSTYVPRDSNGRVHRRLLANYPNTPTQVAPNQELHVNQISDIKCHEPSNQILVTCRSPGSDITMWAFCPTVTKADDPRPRTLLSLNGHSTYRCIHTPGRGGHWHNESHQANTVAPAPSGSNVLSIIGTNCGLVQWHNQTGATSWLTPDRLPTINPGSRSWNDPFRDIFAVEFSANNPQVVFFGGRPGTLFIGDLRSPAAKWDSLTIPSSIIHIRSTGRRNPHQILVSGLRNTLSLYDLRFAKKSSSTTTTPVDSDRIDMGDRSNGRNGKHGKNNNNSRRGNFDRTFKSTDIPVVKFRDYRNAAHVDIGFDYDPISGVVAAAHDDGTVALYSVQSGHRLLSPSPATSSAFSTPTFPYQYSQTATPSAALPRGTRSSPPGRLGISEIKSDRGPIQSLQWQRFPGDQNSSLFVGVQSNIQIYSFGVHEFDEEA